MSWFNHQPDMYTRMVLKTVLAAAFLLHSVFGSAVSPLRPRHGHFRSTTFQKREKRAADLSQVCLKKGHRWGSCQRIVSAEGLSGDEARVNFILVWAVTCITDKS